MLSIIIPTLNEEKYLPLLLESIKKQDFKDYEIIVADAGSRDNTVKIAREYGCRIVPGGLPAKGRNNGAKIASGDILFFLDADTILPNDNFLTDSLQEFDLRKLGIGSFCIEPYPPNKMAKFLLDVFYNRLIISLEKILPHSATGILAKKDIFDKINGYDESIKLSEDHDLARRAAKITKFGLLRSGKILV